jgi:hypothetical protein
MVEIATIALKTSKSSSVSPYIFIHLSDVLILSQNVLLRYHALVLLRKALTTARRAATDSTMKDIIKQMKNALLDKSLPVRRAAAEVRVILLVCRSVI